MTRAADKRSLGRRPSVIKHRGGKATERTRLPVVGHMVQAHGNRDETCARYSECLAAHVEAHRRSDPPASCPRPCGFRVASDERATDYASAPDGGHLARAREVVTW